MVKEERKLEDVHEDFEELSPAWKREIKRRVADACNPVRYVVFSDIGGKGRWRLWLDVSGDGYGMSIDQATPQETRLDASPGLTYGNTCCRELCSMIKGMRGGV